MHCLMWHIPSAVLLICWRFLLAWLLFFKLFYCIDVSGPIPCFSIRFLEISSLSILLTVGFGILSLFAIVLDLIAFFVKMIRYDTIWFDFDSILIRLWYYKLMEFCLLESKYCPKYIPWIFKKCILKKGEVKICS